MAKHPSITCLTCKRTSYNLNDIRERYCGACHKFHESTDDYSLEPPVKDPAMAPNNLALMGAACQVWLSQEQRDVCRRSIETCPEILIDMLAQHSGAQVEPKTFAELFLRACTAALVVHESLINPPPTTKEEEP